MPHKNVTGAAEAPLKLDGSQGQMQHEHANGANEAGLNVAIM